MVNTCIPATFCCFCLPIIYTFYNDITEGEAEQTKIQRAQSSSYDDTATTSSEHDVGGDIPSAGKRSRTSSASSSKSGVSTRSSKASKPSVGSSRLSSHGSSKDNLEDEGSPGTAPAAVIADDAVKQELLDEMIVKDVSDNFGTDPGAGTVSSTHQVIAEEEEGDSEIKVEESLPTQQGE